VHSHNLNLRRGSNVWNVAGRWVMSHPSLRKSLVNSTDHVRCHVTKCLELCGAIPFFDVGKASLQEKRWAARKKSFTLDFARALSRQSKIAVCQLLDRKIKFWHSLQCHGIQELHEASTLFFSAVYPTDRLVVSAPTIPCLRPLSTAILIICPPNENPRPRCPRLWLNQPPNLN